MHRAAVGVATILAMFVVWSTPAKTLDDSLPWDRTMRPGVAFSDGMLAGDLLVVHFAPGANPAVSVDKQGEIATSQLALDALNRAVGVTRFERLFPEVPVAERAKQPGGRELLWLLQFDGTRGELREVAERFLALPTVTRVEPVGFHYLSAEVPNDPSFASQGWLRATTRGPKDIRGVAGWYHAKGDPNVIIAIADSGVDWQHPDLGGSGPDYLDGVIWDNSVERLGAPGVDDDGNGKTDDVRGWDFIDFIPANFPAPETNPPQDASVEDGDPMDYESHGTSVAGCAGAWTNNGVGVAGASWGCTIMPLRIGYLPAGSSVGVVGMHWAARAMDYARQNGAKVFNASWGSSNSGGLGTSTIAAVNADMVIVTAAGNANNEDASYLAARSDVLAVAAVDANDVRTWFSSYGTWVEVSAPGLSTYTTAYDRFAAGAAKHVYGAPSGTSFSSPIVAGVAGLYRSANPSATNTQTMNAIMAAVDEIDSLNDPALAGKLGSGRVNMGKLFGGAPWRMPDQLPTFMDAVNTADPGDEVRVRGGVTITEQLLLPQKAMSFTGGWDASFSTRDLVGNATILDPTSTQPAIRGDDPLGNEVVVDGFEITGASAAEVSLAPDTGRYGGAIFLRDGASPTLRNLNVHGNTAGTASQHGGGGAIAIIGTDPLIEDCEFTNNSGELGAAIYVWQGSPLFRRVNVHGNATHPVGPGISPLGGAVYVLNTSGGDVVRFEDCNLDGNDTAGRGGALYAINSDVEIVGTTVDGNQSDAEGGGIYVEGGSLLLDAVDCNGNTVLPGTSKNGGGIYAKSIALTISNSRFGGNASSFGGGGLALDNCIAPELSGSLVHDNSATVLASGIYLNNCTGSTLTGLTVAQNTGASAGANGIYVSGGNATIANSIFALNGSAGVSLADGVACGGATVVFNCNLAFDNNAGNYGGCPDPTGSDGNIVGDPLFCNPATGDFTIPTSSPAAAAQSACGHIGSEAESCSATAVEGGTPSFPGLDLRQNRPNPFNPSTRIEFALGQAGHARLSIFDSRGRLVRILVDSELPAGEHVVRWNGRDGSDRPVASGTYFYELLLDGDRAVRKMGLVK